MHITRIKRATTILAVLGAGATLSVAGLGASTASAQQAHTSDSYQLTSSTYSLKGNQESDPINARCADGYHVDAQYITNVSNMLQWKPQVTAYGQDIAIAKTDPIDRNGKDADGRDLYRGVAVRLMNDSYLHSRSGSFTWTCVAN